MRRFPSDPIEILLVICAAMLAATLILFGITGCAHAPRPIPSYVPPSSAKVIASAARLHTSAPAELKPVVANLQAEIIGYAGEVQKQTDQLNLSIAERNEAVAQADYYKSKQQKALKELWMWRGLAALMLGSVAAWFALRSGLKLAL
jgi:hypothetical protein